MDLNWQYSVHWCRGSWRWNWLCRWRAGWSFDGMGLMAEVEIRCCRLIVVLLGGVVKCREKDWDRCFGMRMCWYCESWFELRLWLKKLNEILCDWDEYVEFNLFSGRLLLQLLLLKVNCISFVNQFRALNWNEWFDVMK